MPFLLSQVPSVTQYADSGAPAGYSYIYLRGIPQTRMNVTIDGMPINEPEDSAFYFSNFGDLANAVDSIQVQRGVGTSSVGAASFVGSINFASATLAERAGATVRLGTGSFGQQRFGATVNSGEIGGGFRLYGQAAAQDSDGFREHSGVFAEERLPRRPARVRRVVLQGLRLLRPREDATRLPRRGRGHARGEPPGEPDVARRAGRVRAALRHRAVPPRAEPRRRVLRAGVLQRRRRLVPDRQRGGRRLGALPIRPRLVQRGRLRHLPRRHRPHRLHVGRLRQHVREPPRARHRGRPVRVRQPRPQAGSEHVREVRLVVRALAAVRRRPAAMGALPLRGQSRSRSTWTGRSSTRRRAHGSTPAAA